MKTVQSKDKRANYWRSILIHHTCFKCKRRFEFDPVFVGFELSKLKNKKPTHYQAVCPACRGVNKVSVPAIKSELDAAADEIEKMVAEYEESKAKAKAEKEAQKAEKDKKKGQKKAKTKAKSSSK